MSEWTIDLDPEDWEPQLQLKPSQVWQVMKFLSENEIIEWDQDDFEDDGSLKIRPNEQRR